MRTFLQSHGVVSNGRLLVPVIVALATINVALQRDHEGELEPFTEAELRGALEASGLESLA